MSLRHVVVVGASAGGIDPLGELLSGLTPEFEAPVCVVVHLPRAPKSALPEILSRRTRLKVAHAREGDVLRPGCVYVAPQDHHLLIERETLLVRHGPRENRARPAIDVLFRSAAYEHGPRVLGVLLSGSLGDGTAGLWAVKHHGGKAILQAPRDAQFPEMLENARRYVTPDFERPARDLAALLGELVRVEAPAWSREASPLTQTELDVSKGVYGLDAGTSRLGTPTRFTCPECHGVLCEVADRPLPRLRCHTGHGYSADSLMLELSESVDDGLWNALRGLEEQLWLADDRRAQAPAAERAAWDDIMSGVQAKIERLRRALELTRTES